MLFLQSFLKSLPLIPELCEQNKHSAFKAPGAILDAYPVIRRPIAAQCK
jgi:hypothetical protein